MSGAAGPAGPDPVPSPGPPATAARDADSPYAWWRLAATLALMTLGSSAMYVVAVVLPPVQAEFGVARSDASLPYTLLMVGFGAGLTWGSVLVRWEPRP